MEELNIENQSNTPRAAPAPNPAPNLIII